MIYNNIYDYNPYRSQRIEDIKYKELDYRCTKEEADSVRSVIDDANYAFSYRGELKNIKRNIKELKRYALIPIDYKQAGKENHKIELITTKHNDKRGYLWVRYEYFIYDKNGDMLHGSKDVITRWSIEKRKGKWVVFYIMENA